MGRSLEEVHRLSCGALDDKSVPSRVYPKACWAWARWYIHPGSVCWTNPAVHWNSEPPVKWRRFVEFWGRSSWYSPKPDSRQQPKRLHCDRDKQLVKSFLLKALLSAIFSVKKFSALDCLKYLNWTHGNWWFWALVHSVKLEVGQFWLEQGSKLIHIPEKKL